MGAIAGLGIENLRYGRRSWAEWATSRLRTLPGVTFHQVVVLLMMGCSASFVARWLLSQPDRGCVQAATFHTLRTYLTPINKQVRKWRRSFCLDPMPDIVGDAQKWLKHSMEGSG
jgi:hypothetical protein